MVAAVIGLPVLWSAACSAWQGRADPLLLGAADPANAVWARHPLVWSAQLNAAQPWRWWGAAWVHLNGLHLRMNLAGWVAVLAYGLAARLPPRMASAWLLAWPVGHVLLALAPALQFYAGLSGVLHAGVAVVSVALLRDRAGPVRGRRIGALVLLGLALKVILELSGLAGAGETLRVVPLAHATGAIAGAVCAWLVAPASRAPGR